MSGAKEWLVLAHLLTLIVENHPTAAHPTWVNNSTSFDNWNRFPLNLLLNLAPEAVRIRKTDLNLKTVWRQRIVQMGLACQGSSINRPPLGGIIWMCLL